MARNVPERPWDDGRAGPSFRSPYPRFGPQSREPGIVCHDVAVLPHRGGNSNLALVAFARPIRAAGGEGHAWRLVNPSLKWGAAGAEAAFDVSVSSAAHWVWEVQEPLEIADLVGTRDGGR